MLLVGAGGIGGPAAIALAAAGVRDLRVVDDDQVEITNLHRQILYGDDDVGRPKLEVFAEALRRRFPRLRVDRRSGRFTPSAAAALMPGVSVVVDATDNFASAADAADATDAADAAPPERARRLQGYLDVYPGLLRVYSPASDGIDFSVEQAELIVSLFELLKSALDSSRAVTATDPAWADVYSRQQQMTLGVVRGASAMLAEPERYAPALREHVKGALVRLAPAFEQHLEPSAASEVHAIAAADRQASASDSETLR